MKFFELDDGTLIDANRVVAVVRYPDLKDPASNCVTFVTDSGFQCKIAAKTQEQADNQIAKFYGFVTQ